VNPRVTIRPAMVDDCALLLELIRGLAAYENAPDAVVATADDLRRHGFGPEPKFEAILASVDDEVAGMALFFANFSTWLGSPGMYLEDIYVIEAARGFGVGRALMARLAAITIERGWGRIDFAALDWNPARRFYHRLGIASLTEWVPYRAEGEALRRLAAEDDKTRG
jgi:GNAT superfamily N-acetyltransferase